MSTPARRRRAVSRPDAALEELRSGDAGLLVAGASDLPLDLRVSARARRLSLRVDTSTGRLCAVIPPDTPRRAVEAFVRRHADWARKRLACLPQRVGFADGNVVPFLGVDHTIRHCAEARPPVERRAGELRIAGRPEHLERRLRDFLVREARRELSARAHAKAEAIGRRPSTVVVRDTRSRWGSCSSTGRLAFSWRLILAPAPVLDYVVAHEVAHLVEMNHSRRFWVLVGRLCADPGTAKRWLARHGASLHRYG